MKWIHKNRVVSFMIYFAIGSLCLSAFAIYANMSYRSVREEITGMIVFHSAHWASVTIGLHKSGASINFPIAIFVDAIGWGIVGGIFGLIWVGVARAREKKRK